MKLARFTLTKLKGLLFPDVDDRVREPLGPDNAPNKSMRPSDTTFNVSLPAQVILCKAT